MCNLMVKSTIIEVLDDMIQNEQVFTAFDITRGVRSITSDTVSHGDVRDIVNSEFITPKMSGYDRDLCTLDLPNDPQALVYFPDNKTAQDHSLVAGDGTDSTDSTDSTDTDEDDVVLGVDEYQTTKDGRVNIPKEMLTKIDANAGSYDILIRGTLKCATPNKDGRVRISLRDMGISGDKVKLTVDITDNTINLETV